MSLRRVCNVSYAILAENRDQAGLDQLNEQLEAAPGVMEQKRRVEHQRQLLKTMGMPTGG